MAKMPAKTAGTMLPKPARPAVNHPTAVGTSQPYKAPKGAFRDMKH